MVPTPLEETKHELQHVFFLHQVHVHSIVHLSRQVVAGHERLGVPGSLGAGEPGSLGAWVPGCLGAVWGLAPA